MSNLTDELADLNVNARELIERIDGFYNRLDSKTQSSLDSIQALLDSGHVATADNALKLEGKSLEELNLNSIVAIRKAYSNNPITISANATGYLDVEVTMPPLKKQGNVYQIIAFTVANDTTSTSSGIGLALHATTQENVGHFILKQGQHATYSSGLNDHYHMAHANYITDGTEWEGYDEGLKEGEVYKFRVYGQTHHVSHLFNCPTSDYYGQRTQLIVMELDGSLLQEN